MYLQDDPYNPDNRSTLYKTILYFILIVSVFLFVGIAKPVAAKKKIVLEVGAGRILKTRENTKTVFVANTSIADVSSSPGEEVFLYGKSIGTTSLIAIDTRGRQLFEYIVVVIHNLGEINRALNSRFPNENIQILSAKGSIMLVGNVSNAIVHKNIVKTLEKIVGNQTIINQLEVRESNLIRLRVRLFDISRSLSEHIGIDWNGLLVDNGYYANFINKSLKFGKASGKATDINATIDFLVKNGIASVITETNLTTISGKKAEFSVGAEVPLPKYSADSNNKKSNSYSIDYKFIGTKLIFVPRQINNNKLQLNISSSFTNSVKEKATVNGNVFPNLGSRKFSTIVDLEDSQSFVIAGLSMKDMSAALQQTDGNPAKELFKKIFGYETIDSYRREIAIVVTPYFSSLSTKVTQERLEQPLNNIEYILLAGTAPKDPLKLTARFIGPAGFLY